MTWLLLALLACNAPTTDDPAPVEETADTSDTATQDDTDPPAVECEGLDEQACTEAASCASRRAWAIHDGGSCDDLGPRTFLGCDTRPPGDFDCDDMPSLVAPPDAPEHCWLFPSSCIPDGWVACDPMPECDGY